MIQGKEVHVLEVQGIAGADFFRLVLNYALKVGKELLLLFPVVGVVGSGGFLKVYDDIIIWDYERISLGGVRLFVCRALVA